MLWMIGVKFRWSGEKKPIWWQYVASGPVSSSDPVLVSEEAILKVAKRCSEIPIGEYLIEFACDPIGDTFWYK